MDNPRPEKVAVVDEVRGHFDAADAAILTEYRGLKVKDLAKLRRDLRANGGDYRIYKNTLVRFATRELGLDELDPMLVGPTGIAFVKGDAAAAAKTLRDYSRTNALLVIKGGVLGDRVLSSGDTAALAELPSREVLLARFAGGLAAPLQQLAGLLQALPRNLAFGLAALRDQRAAGATDASAPEAVTPEAVTPEAVTPEAVTPEAVTPEAVTPEAALPEASATEAAAPEASPTEAAAPDTASPDAATPDAAAPGAEADAVADAMTPEPETPPSAEPEAPPA